VGRNAAQEKARQSLMVTAAGGVGCPDRFVIGANAPAKDGERVFRRVMREIPKPNDEMGVMCPTCFRKAERLEIANKGFDVLGGGKHVSAYKAPRVAVSKLSLTVNHNVEDFLGRWDPLSPLALLAGVPPGVPGTVREKTRRSPYDGRVRSGGCFREGRTISRGCDANCGRPERRADGVFALPAPGKENPLWASDAWLVLLPFLHAPGGR